MKRHYRTRRMPPWKSRAIAFVLSVFGVGMAYFAVTGQFIIHKPDTKKRKIHP